MTTPTYPLSPPAPLADETEERRAQWIAHNPETYGGLAAIDHALEGVTHRAPGRVFARALAIRTHLAAVESWTAAEIRDREYSVTYTHDRAVCPECGEAAAIVLVSDRGTTTEFIDYHSLYPTNLGRCPSGRARVS